MIKHGLTIVAVLGLGTAAYAGDFRQASAASTLMASQHANARQVERDLERDLDRPDALTGEQREKEVRRQPLGNRGVHSFRIGRGWDQ